MLPLVSIITPAYNRAPFLDETIQSILTQDYPRIEYIILDDGSTDNTREVLDKYTGKVIWITHQNMGESLTVNKGLQMARGEIRAVVNSDDPLLPAAVKTAAEFMESHPDILVAYPDWVKIGPNSEIIERVKVPEYDYLYMLRRHHCIVGPGAFIRHIAFNLAGMRDHEFKYVADFDYWLRLGLYGSFARIPKTLSTFRVHPVSASVSHKGRIMADEHIRLIQKFYSLPDLPNEILKVRAEAFSWAHLVAAEMSGSAKVLAYKNYFKAILYQPSNSTLVLSSVLPKRFFNLFRSIWRMIRPSLVFISRKVFKIVTRTHHSFKYFF